MNRNLARFLVAAAGIGLSSSAFGQVVNTLNWAQPHALGEAGVETVGPRSIVIVDMPAGLVGAAGLVDGDDIIGVVRALSSTGTVLDERAINAVAFIGTTTYANGGTAGVEIDFAQITGITTTFNVAGLRSIQIALSTMGQTISTNSVQTLFVADQDEIGQSGVADGTTRDECGAPDSTAPGLVNAFLQGTNLFLVFGEAMNNGDGTNDDNHTVVANVVDGDFQVNTTNSFTMATDIPMGGFAPTGFADAGNRVLQVDVTGTTNVAIGRFIRVASDDNGVPLMGNNTFDIVGNRATPGGSVATPVTTGVQISTPPTFAVQSVEWNNSRTVNFGTDNMELRVIFTTPIATTGDSTWFQGGGAGSLRRGGVDSDITFAGATVTADPTNPNAILVGITGGSDDVWPDGRDFDGNQYTWNFSTGVGTSPTDIFGQALTTPPASPFTVSDRILPGREFIAFADVDGDGHVDALVITHNEPVTSNAGAGIFTLRKVTSMVHPFNMIAADGTLMEGGIVADANPVNNVVPITTVSNGDVRLPGFPDRLQTGNGLFINFNTQGTNWNNSNPAAPFAMQTPPGTGGRVDGPAGDFITIESSAGFNVNDGNGNTTAEPAIAVQSPTVDRAASVIHALWFLTRDNGNNTAIEQDGDLGDQINNNALVFVGSEPWGPLDPDNVTEEQIGFGPGGVFSFPFDCCGGFSSFGGVSGDSNNLLTMINRDGGGDGNPALIPGVAGSIRAGSGVVDGSGNETRMGDRTSVNRSSLYVPLVGGVDGGNFHAAFLFDADNDGFADSIRITTTQPVDSATVQPTDFTLSLGGPVTTATVEGNDIVLTMADGVVPMSSVITITYRGASDVSRLNSLTSAGGTGVAVAATNETFNARKIPGPDRATQELAFMDIIGTITIGGQPCPPGTKIYAMNAVPQIHRVTATHNNVPFAVDIFSDRSSMHAWNDWLHGVAAFVYLGRDLDNYQYYDNDKDLGDTDDGISTYKDVISLNINASNLTNITFTGTGETSADRVTNGRCFLAWDVLRGAEALVDNLYDPRASPGTRAFTGRPILSSAVVTGTDGRYELHHSAPASLFTGKSRLNSVGRPIILVVEKPDGRRYAVSGVNASINGAPLHFSIQNRAQTAGQSNNATVFNINLDNVGTQQIHPGWNLLAHDRAGGFANTANARPVLPNGVTTGNVVVPTSSAPLQPFSGPLESMVYFGDPNADGRWTRDEDSTFTNIYIDPDFMNYFAFTMTSFGVQFGSGITNFVGGYAMGFFLSPNNDPNNSNGTHTSLGVFQFGAPLSGNTLFDGSSAATTFPNNATTQGWGLFTSKANFGPETTDNGTLATLRSANGNRLDFVFLFRNNGPNGAQQNRPTIEVSSIDLAAPTGNDNPNDTTRVDRGQAFFGHFTP